VRVRCPRPRERARRPETLMAERPRPGEDPEGHRQAASVVRKLDVPITARLAR
jgi:hypothetical protein